MMGNNMRDGSTIKNRDELIFVSSFTCCNPSDSLETPMPSESIEDICSRHATEDIAWDDYWSGISDMLIKGGFMVAPAGNLKDDQIMVSHNVFAEIERQRRLKQ